MRAVLLPFSLVLAGCTSFANVRTAEVRPGFSQALQVSVTTPPGDEASWFWSYDCAFQCNHAIAATDLTLSVGARPSSGPPFTLGAGVTGVFHPYVEGYVQLGQDPRRPFGAGARLGLAPSGWREHQLYARLDAPLNPGTRLLFNPGVFYLSGNSPNGQSPGSFLGLIGALGMELGSGPVAVTPGVTVVLGRAARRSYGYQYSPVIQPFLVFSVALTFREAAPPEAGPFGRP